MARIGRPCRCLIGWQANAYNVSHCDDNRRVIASLKAPNRTIKFLSWYTLSLIKIYIQDAEDIHDNVVKTVPQASSVWSTENRQGVIRNSLWSRVYEFIDRQRSID